MKKMGAQSVRIEECNPKDDSETSYEFDYLGKHVDGKIEIKAYKVFFIQEEVNDEDSVDISRLTFLSFSKIISYETEGVTNSYLLYSVVASPKKHNLYVDKKVPLTNYYFHAIKNYKFNIKENGFKFNILGSPFFQKNSITSFCIQTALATILNHTENNTSLLLPNKINEIGGFSKKDITQGGLTNVQINEFIESKTNFFTKTVDFQEEDTVSLLNDLKKKYDLHPSAIVYPWMESGFPGFIDIKTQNKEISHVVPILGHTLNTDRWPPEADIKYRRSVRNHFRSVVSWVDNFIIHDDNFGMYLCCPTSKFEEKKRKTGHLIEYVFFLVNEEITTNPDTVEIDAIKEVRKILKYKQNKKIKKEANFWWHKLVNEKNAPLISRTLSSSKSNFLETLRLSDNESNKITKGKIKIIGDHIPDSFWLTEISFPDLYTANKSALISIVSDMHNGYIKFMRFPNVCGLCNDKDHIIKSFDIATSGHYDIHEHNNITETFDW